MDSRMQEDDDVWCRGGIDGREACQGRYISSTLRTERWKVEETTLAACVCGAHWECVGPACDPVQVVVWMGHPALDVRLWCDVCLVLARHGHSAPLHQGDRSSDRRCQDGGFRLIDVLPL